MVGGTGWHRRCVARSRRDSSRLDREVNPNGVRIKIVEAVVASLHVVLRDTEHNTRHGQGIVRIDGFASTG